MPRKRDSFGSIDEAGWIGLLAYTVSETHTLAYHTRARVAFEISLLLYHIHPRTSPSYMLSVHGYARSVSSSRGLQSSRREDLAVYSPIRTNLKLGSSAFSVSGPGELN